LTRKRGKDPEQEGSKNGKTIKKLVCRKPAFFFPAKGKIIARYGPAKQTGEDCDPSRILRKKERRDDSKFEGRDQDNNLKGLG